MIQNPSPIEVAPFAGLWISRLCFCPVPVNRAPYLAAAFRPYNGTISLNDPALAVHLIIRDLPAARVADPVLDDAMTALSAECQRQAGTVEDLTMLSVNAPSPTQPVAAILHFTNGATHRINSCYALAATDATFAGVFQATMAEIARQKGLTVT